MNEIAFIDGKTKIRIKNTHLAAYLDKIEAAGYVVKANKCKGKEGWMDVLMIGKARDFEEFFSKNANGPKVQARKYEKGIGCIYS